MPPQRRTPRDRSVPPDDITMAKVRDRLQQGGCPVCRVVTQSARRYLDKHDYRFRDEGVKPEEGVSWMRAIESLVGRDPLEDRLRALTRVG